MQLFVHSGGFAGPFFVGCTRSVLLHIRDKLFDVVDLCMSKTGRHLFGVRLDRRQKDRCTTADVVEAADAIVFTSSRMTSHMHMRVELLEGDSRQTRSLHKSPIGLIPD